MNQPTNENANPLAEAKSSPSYPGSLSEVDKTVSTGLHKRSISPIRVGIAILLVAAATTVLFVRLSNKTFTSDIVELIFRAVGESDAKIECSLPREKNDNSIKPKGK